MARIKEATTHGFSAEEIKLVKTANPSLTDDEIELFLYVAARKGLNPLLDQIYAIKRQVRRESGRFESRLTFLTSIDGLRLLAERTGKYRGQLGPYWCGPDGEWTDVWVHKEPPVAAKVGVLREDFSEPIWGVARYSAYYAGTPVWDKMPDNQTAKCAESQALRKAFPCELGGIYTSDEMDQAAADGENGAVPATDRQPAAKAAKPQQAGLLTKDQQQEIASLYKLMRLPRHGEGGTKALFHRLTQAADNAHEGCLTEEQARTYIQQLRAYATSHLAHMLNVANVREIAKSVDPNVQFSKNAIDGVHPPILQDEQWPAFFSALRREGAARLCERVGVKGVPTFSTMDDADLDRWIDALLQGRTPSDSAQAELISV